MPRTAWRLAVPAVFGVAGLLMATSAATARGTDLRGGRRTDLPALIADREGDLRGLSARSRDLRSEVEALTRVQAERDSRVATAQEAVDALAAPTGLRPARGRAVRVSLDDAPTDGPLPDSGAPDPTPDDLVVHQQDVQSVVNALWAGGATAMTIMGQRVISTSAVRCVGNTLLLHGVVYSPPFVVTAIGDPTRLREALDLAPGVSLFRQYVDAYGLGFEVKDVGTRTLPAYSGPVELTHARPLEDAS